MNQNPYLAFDQKWDLKSEDSEAQPIFLFAAIWRSGSTLLQRLLCSDPSLILWGEPYTDTDLLPRMAQGAKALLQDNWPAQPHFLPNEEVTNNLSKYWIANIYPPAQSYKSAARNMMDSLFKSPAETLGFQRFGFKEVRHTVEVPQFLQWIYPAARFVFLVRNPWDCWASYRGSSWYRRYPDSKIEKVEDFAQVWVENLRSFLSWHDDSGLLLRYEDLIHPDFSLQTLALHCRLSAISSEPLKRKVRGIQSKPTDPNPEESFILNDTCGPLANAFGYFGHHDTRPF